MRAVENGANQMNESKPRLLTGFGEINFGKQYRQGNRVYDSEQIAMCLNSSPVGNTGGYSYLYVVNQKKERTSSGQRKQT